MRPFSVSLVVGFLLAVASVGWVTRSLVLQRERDVTRGWALRPVLVMREALPEGEVLTAEALEEALLPELYVSGSNVAVEDRALVVGRRPNFQLEKGDPVLWGVFTEPERNALTTACLGELRDDVERAGVRAVADAIDAFEKRPRPPLPTAPVAPEPAIEGDMVDVVIADADLAQGSLLARKQLAVRRLPKQFATASHVSRRFIDDVVDTSLTVPMQRGDLLMWQMLDDPAAPRSPMTCVAGAVAARLAARQKVATEGAAAFVQKKAAP